MNLIQLGSMFLGRGTALRLHCLVPSSGIAWPCCDDKAPWHSNTDADRERFNSTKLRGIPTRMQIGRDSIQPPIECNRCMQPCLQMLFSCNGMTVSVDVLYQQDDASFQIGIQSEVKRGGRLPGTWFTELAHNSTISEALEQVNERVVLALYKALAEGDVDIVQRLIASDLEWWFHGPPTEQHLMRLLTGVTSHDSFSFKPVHVRSIGNKVFVEGQGDNGKGTVDEGKCWVHVWTVKGGKLTQLREYFNTSLTVVKPSAVPSRATLWQSQLWKANRKSIPALILAV